MQMIYCTTMSITKKWTSIAFNAMGKDKLKMIASAVIKNVIKKAENNEAEKETSEKALSKFFSVNSEINLRRMQKC